MDNNTVKKSLVNDITDYLLWLHVSTDVETDWIIIKSESDYNMFNSLLGKTLTLIDASVSDKEQRAAMKWIIKDLYYKEQVLYRDIIYKALWWNNLESWVNVNFK